MKTSRLAGLITALTEQTVLGELLMPAERALDRCRVNIGQFRSLSMLDFITLGVLRHLQGVTTLRAMVQSLAHEVDALERPPIARSTWGDALASGQRLKALHQVRSQLLTLASSVCSDRLADLPSLSQRAVYAMDGSYQHESAHFNKTTKDEGGEDNPKGHCLLSIFDVRLGCVADVHVETRSRHEVPIMHDYDATEGALTKVKGALWLVDRAFIKAEHWDLKKHKDGITLITRMRSDLSINSNEHLEVSQAPCNEGVVSDERITLNSSKQYWRLITYVGRRGREVQFLSNDFDLEPGVVAFLYSRRWDEEKAFDVWKNDLAMGKAWGKSPTSITNQVVLAVITQLLLALFLGKHGLGGASDDKSRRKQEAREAGKDGGTDRPEWSEKVYRYASRLSRQVLRFFACCYRKRVTPQLYDRQLRPLFERYL